MKERVSYFDTLRGIAILMVIAIHTYNLKDGDAALAIRQIFNCAVPLFLAISGYFLAKKDVCNADTYRAFLSKQIPKIYIPVVIWSLPLYALSVRSRGFDIVNLLTLMVCGYSIYYFVALIIQYYLLLPVLQKFNNINSGGVTVCVSIVCISVVTCCMQVLGNSLPLIVYAGPCILWIMFFVEGIIISNLKTRNYSIKWWCIAAMAALALQYFESKYLLSYGHGGVGIKPSSFLFSGIMIVLFFSQQVENIFKKVPKLNSALIKIGSASFGIYLIHCYVIMTAGLMLRYGLSDYWTIRWIYVSAATYLIIYCARNVLPHTILKYLGF